MCTDSRFKIGDNIALGDSNYADDDQAILKAAPLGGADDIIDGLPEGIERLGLREGTLTFAGRPVGYANIHIRRPAGMDPILTKSLISALVQPMSSFFKDKSKKSKADTGQKNRAEFEFKKRYALASIFFRPTPRILGKLCFIITLAKLNGRLRYCS
ncbi:hypothetical protein M378DRAFT_13039 [Amanita muscaria Koide BX008]|uniref:Uncharacterized protein n=1 Tax=Amanita muscaria (strain Koide BX008) TaxID=946122 RepID=A0A0C2T6J7_AMAMK|nr:hypothetical protein M378DRAFT_13039 [Amanita muscaria Koide BX008]